MMPSEILSNVPQSMRLSVGENTYHYAIQSIKQGIITFSANGDALKEICFEDAPDDFKQRLENDASEKTNLALIAQTLGTSRALIAQTL